MDTVSVLTLRLAEALGLYLVAVGASGLIAPDRWRALPDEMERSFGLTLVMGLVAFAIGAMIFGLHHSLGDPLAAIVTIAAAIAAVEGLLLLAVPQAMVAFARPFLARPLWLGDRRGRARPPPLPRRPHRPRHPLPLNKDPNMADIPALSEVEGPARTELKVTTGPIRGSRKIYVGERRVAMREVDLEPTSGEPPLRVYDCSGPYTDPGRAHRHHGRPRRSPPRLDPRPRRRRGGAPARGPPRG